MAVRALNRIVEHLRNILLKQECAGPDADLLNRFIQQKDETAFEALVRRHGPMVMGVCHRILRNSHDAEDAFQATFLILVRKASTIRPPRMVGNWLYGVAYRTAQEARKSAVKRRVKEANVVPRTETPKDTWDSLLPVLDQELERLPEKYRAVIIHCDLEGKTRREVAEQLGWPEGTVAGRLATARTMLAKRLARHGFGVSAGVLATMLGQNASACVPLSVVSATVKAGMMFAAGQTATGMISVEVATLTKGLLQSMLLTKMKMAAAALVVAAVVCGAAELIYPSQATEPPEAQQANDRPKAPKTEKAEQKQPKEDLAGLQGTWRAVGTEFEGLRMDERRRENKDVRLVFEKSSFTLSGKMYHDPRLKKEPEDYKQVVSFTLDTKKNPKEITLAWEEDPWNHKKNIARRGIYSLEGDTLKLCLNLDEDASKLPTEFSAKYGSKRYLLILKRGLASEKREAKKAGEPAPAQPASDKKQKRAGGTQQEKKKKLQGTWRQVSFAADGISVEDEGHPLVKENRLVIQQSSLTLSYTDEWTSGDTKKPERKEAVADFQLDTEQNPKVIMLTWKEFPSQKDLVGKAIKAIYDLDGNRLRLCWQDEGKEAPTEFSAKGGSKRMLWTFKRIPPSQNGGEKKPSQEGQQGVKKEEKAPAAPAKENEQPTKDDQEGNRLKEPQNETLEILDESQKHWKETLSKIDRTIKKEPAYKSKPKYCLLVFGPRAESRIWLVLDGDELYVDRDADGDLTGKEKKTEKLAIPEPNKNQQTTWFLRHVPTPQGKITVEVTQTKHDRIRNNHLVSVFLEDERVKPGCLQRAGYTLEPTVFADRPQDAPILHFFGPRRMYLAYFDLGPPRLTRGLEGGELYVTFGTHGLGKGSFVTHSHLGIPKDAHVVLDLEFPSKEATGKRIRQRVTLTQRC